MKFSGVIALTLAAAVAAQSSSVTASASSSAPASSSAAPSTTVPLSPQQSCILKCPDNDVNCKAACVGVPYPNDGQVNKTTECAAKCNQGNGSPADTEAFAKCQQDCIQQHFLSGSATLPVQTGGSSPTGGASGSGSNSGSQPTATGSSRPSGSSGSGSGTGSATGTGASATATSSRGAAAGVVGASSGTLVGLLLAALAL